VKNIVWPSPVNTFLRVITYGREELGFPAEKKILDCAAGGSRPPLGLFYEHGFETWGIDLSDEQFERARAFCTEHGMEINIQKGDMRDIPFEDESFDYVYEFYSLCHLTKAGTALAIKEMMRVLRKGGLCFLGFMSVDCWPIMGRRIGDGEFRLIEHGQEVTHTVYGDDEADKYFAGLEIIQKDKIKTWFKGRMAGLSQEDWEEWYKEEWMEYDQEEWSRMYGERLARVNYTHVYYIVRKPA
jgi:ubiquinone/menaquinone biosynthesis C-methylase UbiE